MPSSVHPVPLHAGDALVIVDVQSDFLPGGRLAVPRGDEVVAVLNGWPSGILGKSYSRQYRIRRRSRFFGRIACR